MWSVPVRFLVMWSPIVAVTIGGGIYLAECTQTLLSPGTGFTMDYPAKVGTLKIECKTYSFDPFQQTLIVDRLVIHKSDGTLLARVPHLTVTGIVVDEGFAPKLQLKDAELWVNRDAKGELKDLHYTTWWKDTWRKGGSGWRNQIGLESDHDPLGAEVVVPAAPTATPPPATAPQP